MMQVKTLILLIATALPAAGLADEVVFPELGVRISDLPVASGKPQVVERPAGYEGVVHTGSTTDLRIYRADDPVPPGSVAEEAYRLSLFAKLNDEKAGQTKGALMSIGGHEAWTIINEHGLLGSFGVFDYKAYLVVDQHLYRILVSSFGPHRPTAFDWTVKKVSAGTSFEPIQRPASAPYVAGTMPRFVTSGQADYYPPTSVRRGEQGAVDVVFSIDGSGRARDISAIYAAFPDLGHGVAALLQDGVFKVPENWVQTASDKMRFSLEVQFILVAPDSTCLASQAAPRIAGTKVISICHSSAPPIR